MKFAPNYGGVLDAKTMAYVLEIIEGGAFSSIILTAYARRRCKLLTLLPYLPSVA